MFLDPHLSPDLPARVLTALPLWAECRYLVEIEATREEDDSPRPAGGFVWPTPHHVFQAGGTLVLKAPSTCKLLKFTFLFPSDSCSFLGTLLDVCSRTWWLLLIQTVRSQTSYSNREYKQKRGDIPESPHPRTHGEAETSPTG